MTDDIKPMTAEEIQAARALCEATTPGKWRAEGPVWIRPDNLGGTALYTASTEDAAFIAAAPALVRQILDEVERLHVAVRFLSDSRQRILDDAAKAITDQQAEIDRLRAELEVHEPAEEPCSVQALCVATICVCCGGPIPAGTLVALFKADEDRDVAAHAGPCPEPVKWYVDRLRTDLAGWHRVRSQYGEPIAKPYEDALSLVRAVRRSPRTLRVRLVRVHPASRGTALLDRPVPNGEKCTYRKAPCGRDAVEGRCDRHRDSERGSQGVITVDEREE